MKRNMLLHLTLIFVAVFSHGCSNDTGQSRNDTTFEGRNGQSDPAETNDVKVGPLIADGRYFRDSQGAVIILRGVNVAGNSKVPPFIAVSNASELDILPTLGVNAIRLLFTWEAFEPVQGEYNEDYLAYYMQVVQWAEQLNMYVVVDFHQDAYSRYSLRGCGEGFPRWAVTPEVEVAIPDNGESCSSWGVEMLSDESLETTWSHFHSDKYHVKDAYLKMVKSVAERVSTHDNVIGYELINEPWGTDDELFALFNQIGKSIRERDPNAILFIPTHTLVSGGVRDDTLDNPDLSNIVYSPHYYDGSVLLLKSWSGTDPAQQLNKLREKADAWGVPMFLSEFGAPTGTENGQEYIATQIDWLNRYWISSAQWNFTPGWREDVKDGWNMEDLSIIDDQKTTRDNFILRPYPQKIAGVPNSFVLDEEGFALTWQNSAACGSTVIFLPEGYSRDRNLSLDLPDGAEGSCHVSDYRIICEVDGPGDTTVSVMRPRGTG